MQKAGIPEHQDHATIWPGGIHTSFKILIEHAECRKKGELYVGPESILLLWQNHFIII